MATTAARPPLARLLWLSIAAALATISLKTLAWGLTGSVGVLSDALESLVNLGRRSSLLVALVVAARPPDEEHNYGYEKAEYFSSGFEGALILVAALSIGVAAGGAPAGPATAQRRPRPGRHGGGGADQPGDRPRPAGRLPRYRSITLEADARHLLSDVWTSAGVIAGVGAVALSGRWWLDPAIALLAANIVRTGARWCAARSPACWTPPFPPASGRRCRRCWTATGRSSPAGLQFHALRTRQSGPRRFLTVHVLVPGAWSVQRGHDMLEPIEADLRRALPSPTRPPTSSPWRTRAPSPTPDRPRQRRRGPRKYPQIGVNASDAGELPPPCSRPPIPPSVR